MNLPDRWTRNAQGCNLLFFSYLSCMSAVFNYGIDQLTVSTVLSIASAQSRGILNRSAIERVKASQQFVNEIVASNKTVYGVNTGFGILANTRISAADTAT